MKKKTKFFDCLKKFLLEKNYKNIISVHRKRNSVKIVKIFINGENKGYIELNKLNRNLHIEVKNDNEVDLFSDY